MRERRRERRISFGNMFAPGGPDLEKGPYMTTTTTTYILWSKSTTIRETERRMAAFMSTTNMWQLPKDSSRQNSTFWIILPEENNTRKRKIHYLLHITFGQYLKRKLFLRYWLLPFSTIFLSIQYWKNYYNI